MLSIYPACFFKEDNGYSVIFPDLNYLATQGDTLEDAVAMAVAVGCSSKGGDDSGEGSGAIDPNAGYGADSRVGL